MDTSAGPVPLMPDSLDSLIPHVYHELHRMAQGYLRRELQNLTLQPTSLVHEAYLRLVDQGATHYHDRAHFFGVAARVMRQILVDHARARHAIKRAVPPGDLAYTGERSANERSRIVVALDDALQALSAHDETRAHLVELRFFAGMTAQEIAGCTGIPLHHVRRELRIALAWLQREITLEM